MEAAGAMSKTISAPNPPVIRIRLNHAYSVRDGWRLAETTVELTAPVPDDEAGRALMPSLQGLLRNAYAAGIEEKMERNREELR